MKKIILVVLVLLNVALMLVCLSERRMVRRHEKVLHAIAKALDCQKDLNNAVLLTLGSLCGADTKGLIAEMEEGEQALNGD